MSRDKYYSSHVLQSWSHY